MKTFPTLLAHGTWSRMMRAFAACMAVLAWNSGAMCESAVTVSAAPESVEAGIKSYEVSAEFDGSTAEAFWFCQVVGNPSFAGSICVSVAENQAYIIAVVRHARSGSELKIMLLSGGSLFVTRGSEQVASLILPPIGSDALGIQVGFDELAVDPAWRMFCSAMADPSLRASMLARGDVETTDCVTQCSAQYPDRRIAILPCPRSTAARCRLSVTTVRQCASVQPRGLPRSVRRWLRRKDWLTGPTVRSCLCRSFRDLERC